MTPVEKKLAIHLLKIASQQFGNHGCNDLHLTRDVGLTPDESFDLRQRLQKWLPDLEVPTRDNHTTFDWLAMDFIIEILQGQESVK